MFPAAPLVRDTPEADKSPLRLDKLRGMPPAMRPVDEPFGRELRVERRLLCIFRRGG